MYFSPRHIPPVSHASKKLVANSRIPEHASDPELLVLTHEDVYGRQRQATSLSGLTFTSSQRRDIWDPIYAIQWLHGVEQPKDNLWRQLGLRLGLHMHVFFSANGVFDLDARGPNWLSGARRFVTCTNDSSSITGFATGSGTSGWEGE